MANNILDEITDHEEALQLVAKKKPTKMKSTMKPPGNERRVLTWARDCNGIEFWQFDSYSNGRWFEAHSWSHKVLYWEEMKSKPNYNEGK